MIVCSSRSTLRVVWTVRQLLGVFLAGLALLGFGVHLGQQRAANERGMYPIAMALKGAGLALLSWALWRHVRANML